MKQPNLAVNNSLDIQKVYIELLRLETKSRNNDTKFAETIHTIISYCYRIDKYGIV